MRLLRFYPRAWRERYGDEMRVLLEQHHVSVRTRIDLLRGALDAQLHRRSPVMNRNHRPSVRWSFCMALLPSAFLVARWAFQLAAFTGDSTLLNALIVLGMLAVVYVAVRSGTGARRMGGSFGESAVAGGIVGMAALLIASIVSWGLTVAGLAGVFAWAADLEGGSGHIAFSFGPYLAQTWAGALIGAGAFAAAGCLIGAVLGLAGGRLATGVVAGWPRKIAGRLGSQLSAWAQRSA